MVIHHPLRLWRFNQGFTLKKAAFLIGCGLSTLSDIETRRKLPSGRVALKIAQVTKLSLEEVMGRPKRTKKPEGSDAVSI